MKISEQLKSVLCDPSGNASIQGSTADLEVINEALSKLVLLENRIEAMTKKHDPAMEIKEHWDWGNCDDSFSHGYEIGENDTYAKLEKILNGEK